MGRLAAPSADEVHQAVEPAVGGDDTVEPRAGGVGVEQVHDAALGLEPVEPGPVGIRGSDDGTVSGEASYDGTTGRAAGTGDRDDAGHAAAVMPRVSAITFFSFLASASKNMLSGNSSASTSSTSSRGCWEKSSASAPRAHFDAGCGAR